MKQLTLGLIACSVSVPFFAAPVRAQSSSFFDDFEGDLSQWIAKSSSSQAIIVEDPLRPGNHVLTFLQVTAGGDLFGTEVIAIQGETLILSFEYLGLPNLGGIPGDLGGTLGIAESTPGRHRWLAGTTSCCHVEEDLLIDDGQWHTYVMEIDVFASGLPGQFTDFSEVPPRDDTIRIMLQDFNESLGVGGDVFFDNIVLGDQDQDSDDDGVDDADDACPDSDLSASIVIDGCDTGVENLLFEDGCTMADRIALCADEASKHGEFVSCVAHLTNEWRRSRLITGQEKGRIQRCAAQASIPVSDETVALSLEGTLYASANLCPSDLDGDGSVAISDMVALLEAWGTNPDSPSDLDGDGIVAMPDLLLLVADWGACP